MRPLKLLQLMRTAISTIGLLTVLINAALLMASQPPRSIHYQEPSGGSRGTPTSGNRIGGGSRGNCPLVKEYLTALVPAMPSSQQQSPNTLETPESVRGLTFSSTPTFWFYVPYTAPLAAEFVLLDEKGTEYKQTVSLPAKPGVISVLPTAKPLEVEKSYRWIFSVLCDPKSPSANAVVKGWVQRVAIPAHLMPQTSTIETATLHDRAALLAANGIWFDAVTLLGNARFNQPLDAAIANDWENLLSSVGLENVAKAPLVQHARSQR